MNRRFASPLRRTSTGRSAGTSSAWVAGTGGRADADSTASDLGAVLLFDFNNIRYVTSTHIGEWARDKMTRYALLTRGGDPHIWDFGSAAKHHGSTARGSPGERPRRDDRAARRGRAGRRPVPGRRARDRAHPQAEGVADMPLGVDIVEPPMLAALEAEGITVRDGAAGDARRARGQVDRRDHPAQHGLRHGRRRLPADRRAAQAGRPRERARGRRHQVPLRPGSEHVDNINAVSGERCSPHPHVFSDRIIRPGDQAFFDIIHTFIGYKTCYYRTFVVGAANDAQRDAYKQAREWIDASIELMRPGVTTDQVAKVWPRPRSSGSPARWSASGSSSGTASGCSSTSGRSSAGSTRSITRSSSRRAWSSPSRPTARRRTAVGRRIEEEVVVTADGPQVITRFPSDELFVANAY